MAISNLQEFSKDSILSKFIGSSSSQLSGYYVTTKSGATYSTKTPEAFKDAVKVTPVYSSGNVSYSGGGGGGGGKSRSSGSRSQPSQPQSSFTQALEAIKLAKESSQSLQQQSLKPTQAQSTSKFKEALSIFKDTVKSGITPEKILSKTSDILQSARPQQKQTVADVVRENILVSGIAIAKTAEEVYFRSRYLMQPPKAKEVQERFVKLGGGFTDIADELNRRTIAFSGGVYESAKKFVKTGDISALSPGNVKKESMRIFARMEAARYIAEKDIPRRAQQLEEEKKQFDITNALFSAKVKEYERQKAEIERQIQFLEQKRETVTTPEQAEAFNREVERLNQQIQSLNVQAFNLSFEAQELQAKSEQFNKKVEELNKLIEFTGTKEFKKQYSTGGVPFLVRFIPESAVWPITRPTEFVGEMFKTLPQGQFKEFGKAAGIFTAELVALEVTPKLVSRATAAIDRYLGKETGKFIPYEELEKKGDVIIAPGTVYGDENTNTLKELEKFTGEKVTVTHATLAREFGKLGKGEEIFLRGPKPEEMSPIRKKLDLDFFYFTPQTEKESLLKGINEAIKKGISQIRGAKAGETPTAAGGFAGIGFGAEKIRLFGKPTIVIVRETPIERIPKSIIKGLRSGKGVDIYKDFITRPELYPGGTGKTFIPPENIGILINEKNIVELPQTVKIKGNELTINVAMGRELTKLKVPAELLKLSQEGKVIREKSYFVKSTEWQVVTPAVNKEGESIHKLVPNLEGPLHGKFTYYTLRKQTPQFIEKLKLGGVYQFLTKKEIKVHFYEAKLERVFTKEELKDFLPYHLEKKFEKPFEDKRTIVLDIAKYTEEYSRPSQIYPLSRDIQQFSYISLLPKKAPETLRVKTTYAATGLNEPVELLSKVKTKYVLPALPIQESISSSKKSIKPFISSPSKLSKESKEMSKLPKLMSSFSKISSMSSISSISSPYKLSSISSKYSILSSFSKISSTSSIYSPVSSLKSLSSKLSLPSIPEFPWLPFSLPKPTLDFAKGFQGTQIGKQLIKYQPQLRALVLGIKGRPPKTLTGLEFRPIPTYGGRARASRSSKAKIRRKR